MRGAAHSAAAILEVFETMLTVDCQLLMADKYFDRREAEELLPAPSRRGWRRRASRSRLWRTYGLISPTRSRIMVLGGTFPPFADLMRKKSEHEQDRRAAEPDGQPDSGNRMRGEGSRTAWWIFPACGEAKRSICAGNSAKSTSDFWHGIDEGFAGRKPLEDDGRLPRMTPVQ